MRRDSKSASCRVYLGISAEFSPLPAAAPQEFGRNSRPRRAVNPRISRKIPREIRNRSCFKRFSVSPILMDHRGPSVHRSDSALLAKFPLPPQARVESFFGNFMPFALSKSRWPSIFYPIGMILPEQILTDNSSPRLLFFNRVSARSILSLFLSFSRLLLLLLLHPIFLRTVDFHFRKAVLYQSHRGTSVPRVFRRELESFSFPIRPT